LVGERKRREGSGGEMINNKKWKVDGVGKEMIAGERGREFQLN